MRPLSTHPVSNITWLIADDLTCNDWNPNVVITPELNLLKLSLLRTGWLQPVLVNPVINDAGAVVPGEYMIIDGFHRTMLVRADIEVRALTGGLVPCCIMDLSEPERMMLTVRINRAKGGHVAFKMHELVQRLVRVHNVPPNVLAQNIGATKHEVDLLLMDDVFEKIGTANHKYSQAWVPK